jgi:hypothetical protein
MIISLFMDETPLLCGCGDHPGAGAAEPPAARRDGQAAAGRRREDDEQDQDVHVSATLKTREGPRRRGAGLSW